MRGDIVEVYPSYDDVGLRIGFFGDEVDEFLTFDPLTGREIRPHERITVYPKSHFVTPRSRSLEAIESIKVERARARDDAHQTHGGGSTHGYHELGVRVRYLHSDIDTLERVQILRDLRLGTFDVLVGINLLREGLLATNGSLLADFLGPSQGASAQVTQIVREPSRKLGTSARPRLGAVLAELHAVNFLEEAMTPRPRFVFVSILALVACVLGVTGECVEHRPQSGLRDRRPRTVGREPIQRRLHPVGDDGPVGCSGTRASSTPPRNVSVPSA